MTRKKSRLRQQQLTVTRHEGCLDPDRDDELLTLIDQKLLGTGEFQEPSPENDNVVWNDKKLAGSEQTAL